MEKSERYKNELKKQQNFTKEQLYNDAHLFCDLAGATIMGIFLKINNECKTEEKLLQSEEAINVTLLLKMARMLFRSVEEMKEKHAKAKITRLTTETGETIH